MNILDSRILLKRSTTAGATPTVPASSSHTDGTWVNTDIYEGELFLNTADARLFTRQGSNIKEIGLQNSLIGTSRFATLTLTSAQILDLYTTPITLVSAPGVGKTIVLKNAWARLNFNTTAYFTAFSPTIYMYLGIQGANGNIAINEDVVQSAITRVTKFHMTEDVVAVNQKNYVENAALRILLDADPTVGDGTIDILLEYMVLDFDTIF